MFISCLRNFLRVEVGSLGRIIALKTADTFRSGSEGHLCSFLLMRVNKNKVLTVHEVSVAASCFPV